VLNKPRCYERRCKHFVGVRAPDDSETGEVPVCFAFPDGMHVAAWTGDGGVRYEELGPDEDFMEHGEAMRKLDAIKSVKARPWLTN
jgi:hypothetical protein